MLKLLKETMKLDQNFQGEGSNLTNLPLEGHGYLLEQYHGSVYWACVSMYIQ